MKKLDYKKASKFYSDNEIKSFVKKNKGKVRLINGEGIGTFVKSMAEATGIPNTIRNASAASSGLLQLGTQKRADKQAQNTTDLANQIAIAKKSGNTELLGKLLQQSKDNYEKTSGRNSAVNFNEKFADNTLSLREKAGTTGSFNQGVGSGLKTIGKGLLDGAKAAGTVAGAVVNPIGTLKTAAVMAPVGGTISKLSGGTFSEGAGSGAGSAAYFTALGGILKSAKIQKGEKVTAAKLKKFNTSANSTKQKIWKKAQDIFSKPEYKKFGLNNAAQKKAMEESIKASGATEATKQNALQLLKKEASKGSTTLLEAFEKGRNYKLVGNPSNGTELFQSIFKKQFNTNAVKILSEQNPADAVKVIDTLQKYGKVARIQSMIAGVKQSAPGTIARIGFYALLSKLIYGGGGGR